jgi:polyketide synthase PksM
VTGKFGPFMLRSILQRKEVERVICVIRNKARTSAKDRFKAVFEPLDILKDIDMSRVELVSGDISEKHFGLNDTEWENLCNKVDGVVHCAVKANLMDAYTRFGKDGNISNKGTDIRTVNVIGSLNVMEMCVSGAQVKPLFFASTLLANQKTSVKEKTMWEDWYVGEEVFQLKNTGYPVSKFICEVLLKQFSDVGVPVGVFRFPALFGDSKSGRFTLQNNHAAMRLLGFCKLGAIPAIPLPIQVLPSDLAADLSLQIF